MNLNNNININNVNSLMRIIALQKINIGGVVIDATLGNGNDIEFLLGVVGETGYAYGFDVQEISIQNTLKKLEDSNISSNNYKLILDGHENVDKYVDSEVDFAVFNLGYLPKGNHEIITKAKTTVDSIEKILKLLKKGGCICISSYISHEGGKDEYEKLKLFLENIEQKKFNVVEMNFINQVNTPPRFFIIEKR